MDGVPVFNLVRETMPAIAIEGFRGVINSTCNYILTELERGKEFDAALAEMQARGIAEADPTLDVDGWDAAAKAAALVNVLTSAMRWLATAASGWSRRRRATAARCARSSSRRNWTTTTPWRTSSVSRTRCISTPTCSARSASSNEPAASRKPPMRC